MQQRLYDLAHARAGDKGNISNISVIAYDPADYERLRRQVTPERVKAHFAGVVRGAVERYELPRISPSASSSTTPWPAASPARSRSTSISAANKLPLETV